MPAENLVVYDKIPEATAALEAGDEIDIVVMDRLPAEAAVQDRNVVLIGRGLTQQRFAIAVPKGAVALRHALNEALITLHNEGVVANIAQTYLDLRPQEVLAAPTPDTTQTTPTPAPADTNCLDGMDLVEHLSYGSPDMTEGADMAPGATFQKGWRLINTGTCPWDETYSALYVDGNRPGADMKAAPVYVQGSVAPGQSYDVYADLTAPEEPGLYQGLWAMRTPDLESFGRRIPVVINVVEPQ